MSTRPVLAIDLGGTKISAAVVDAPSPHSDGLEQLPAPSLRDGTQVRTATPAQEGAQAVMETVRRTGAEALSRAGCAHPVAVGIGSAGIIDPATGAVTHATDALPGWPGTPLAAALEETFGAPTRALNDVHAHGFGEALFGVGAGHSNVLVLAVGTGIGGALLLNGQLVAGAGGVAGHLGHLPCPEATGLLCTCGRSGHLEALASGPAIAAWHRRLSPPEDQVPDTREVARRAEAGDALSREVIHGAGVATGRLLGGLLNALNPDVVAVTGGVADIGDIWWEALREGVAHDAMDAVRSTPVRPAQAGNSAALLGAAHHALAGLSLPATGA